MKNSGLALRWILPVINLLFPQNCIFCSGVRREGGEYLCGTCLGDIGFINPPLCFICGVPPDISYEYPHDEFICGVCRKNPYEFDRARSLGLYDTVLRKLIHHFKYQKQLGVMSDINLLLEKYFDNYGKEYQGFTVAPIPLHFSKMKERGFDQAFLLARQVARFLEAPLESALLRRISETSPQATKTKTERANNIKGAFEINRPELISGKDVLLVDDVFTTGATANEASMTLKKSGSGNVYIFTLGRVVIGKGLDR